ncbi:unnamed protein product [Nyctereutes procyonoides]|uniref:(raccoon dog) hypothetical protein n=1 Tax=Nyctereutes procyonoides TaxID=34880 RepID=A0A811YUP4_NYCPR|nr:unnamed protein product [Nyctereutes procyonoides]
MAQIRLSHEAKVKSSWTISLDPPSPVGPLDETSVPVINLSETLSPNHQLRHLQVLNLQKLVLSLTCPLPVGETSEDANKMTKAGLGSGSSKGKGSGPLPQAAVLEACMARIGVTGVSRIQFSARKPGFHLSSIKIKCSQPEKSVQSWTALLADSVTQQSKILPSCDARRLHKDTK